MWCDFTKSMEQNHASDSHPAAVLVCVGSYPYLLVNIHIYIHIYMWFVSPFVDSYPLNHIKSP